MSARIMQSKFAGVCRDCGKSVPRGATIAYHGRGCGISCAACAGTTGASGARRQNAAMEAYIEGDDSMNDERRETVEEFNRRDHSSHEDRECGDTAYEDRCAEACGL